MVWFHDRQNVFGERPEPVDGALLVPHTWRADATLDELIDRGVIPPVIAVAPQNGGADRTAEFSHTPAFPLNPVAEQRILGPAYESFLVEEVRPWVIETLGGSAAPADNVVIGSSMGGLVSYHLAFRRPDVWGGCGILSPYLEALGLATGAEAPVRESFDVAGPQRVWLDMGDSEAKLTVAQAQRLRDDLIDRLGYRPDDNVRWRVDHGGRHNELAWAARLPGVLAFLFGAAWPERSRVEHRPAVQRRGDDAFEAHVDRTAAHGGVDSVVRPGLAPDEIVDAEPVCRVRVVIDRSSGESGALEYSWLPIPAEADEIEFALPWGTGLDGVLLRTRDGARATAADGIPLLTPQRIVGDTQIRLAPGGWTPGRPGE